MTKRVFDQLFNKITEENAEEIIQLYLNHLDTKFMEASKKGHSKSMAFLKKEYTLLVKKHEDLLNSLEKK